MVRHTLKILQQREIKFEDYNKIVQKVIRQY